MDTYWVTYDGTGCTHIRHKSQDVSMDHLWVAYDGMDGSIFFYLRASRRQHAQIPKAPDLRMDTLGIRIGTSPASFYCLPSFHQTQIGDAELFLKANPSHLHFSLRRLGNWLLMPGPFTDKCAGSQLRPTSYYRSICCLVCRFGVLCPSTCRCCCSCPCQAAELVRSKTAALTWTPLRSYRCFYLATDSAARYY